MDAQDLLAAKSQKLLCFMQNIDRQNLASRFVHKKLLENDFSRYLVLSLLQSLHHYYFVQNETTELPHFDQWFYIFEKKEKVALWNWMSDQGADTHIGMHTQSYKTHMQPSLMGRLYRTWFSILTQHHANLLFWESYHQQYNGFLVSHPLLDYKGIDALMLAPDKITGQWSASELQLKKASFKFKKPPRPEQILVSYETLSKSGSDNRYCKRPDSLGNLVPIKAYQKILDNPYIDIHDNLVITFNKQGAQHYAEQCFHNKHKRIDTYENLMNYYNKLCDKKLGDPNLENLWKSTLGSAKKTSHYCPELILN